MNAVSKSDEEVTQQLLDYFVSQRNAKSEASQNPLLSRYDHEFHLACAETHAWAIDRIFTLLDTNTTAEDIITTLSAEANQGVETIRQWAETHQRDNFYYGKISAYRVIGYICRTIRD